MGCFGKRWVPLPLNAKRNSLLKIITVGGSSTKLSKFLTQGGDSSTFFFNLVFKLILVFFLFLKLAISIFSKAFFHAYHIDPAKKNNTRTYIPETMDAPTLNSFMLQETKRWCSKITIKYSRRRTEEEGGWHKQC